MRTGEADILTRFHQDRNVDRRERQRGAGRRGGMGLGVHNELVLGYILLRIDDNDNNNDNNNNNNNETTTITRTTMTTTTTSPASHVTPFMNSCNLANLVGQLEASGGVLDVESRQRQRGISSHGTRRQSGEVPVRRNRIQVHQRRPLERGGSHYILGQR